MKPAEIYRKHPVADDVYYIDGAWASACITAVEKRFTEAELCAEFEAARCDWMLADQTGSYWSLLGDTWSHDPDAVSNRVQTLLRMATSQHHDEADQ